MFYILIRYYKYLVILFSLTNILIFTKLLDLTKYIKQVTQVLKKLIKKGLQIKLEKYEFYKEEVTFLRFITRYYRILIDPAKYKAV